MLSTTNPRRAGTRTASMVVTASMMAAVVSTVLSPATAAADGWGTVDCESTTTPQCELEAGQQTTSPPPRPRPGGGDQPADGAEHAGGDHVACGYQPSGFRPPAAGAQAPPLLWYEGPCTTTGMLGTPVALPAVSPEAVARLARDQLRLPTPSIATSPARVQLVHLPTWLRLASGWETRSATATVPGVSVTATARPVAVSWSMGDGHTVTCAGRGSPYRVGTNPRAPSPDCGHTYRRASGAEPDGTFTVTATVRWTVTWSGAGASGSFADLTTTATADVRVAESQALNIPSR